jgi:hypothetical protein
MGSKSSAVVVLDRTELSKPEVIIKANIIPLALLGKIESILLAMILCKPVFSTPIAIKNPPKKQINKSWNKRYTYQ